MMKGIQRRLEALEQQHAKRVAEARARDAESRSLAKWIVLVYYLGDLKLHKPSLNTFSDGLAKALNYRSREDMPSAPSELSDSGRSELATRFDDAYRRLFAKFGLDYDVSSESEQIEALCEMKKAVPHEWVRFIESKTGRAK